MSSFAEKVRASLHQLVTRTKLRGHRCLLCHLICFLSFGLVLPSFVLAQASGSPADAKDYEQKGASDYRSKNFKGFLENLLLADALLPQHPRITFNLAVAYVLNQRAEDSVAALSRLVDMKLLYSFDKNEHFASLKGVPEFQNLVAKNAVNALPTGKAELAFSLPEKGIVAESVAYDRISKSFFIGSVAQRRIIRIDNKGEAHLFADQTTGLWSVFGIKIDVERGVLWAASSAHKQMPGLVAGEDGMTGVFKYELKSGKLLKKYLIANHQRPRWLGDLTIAPNGDVYATDSIAPAIYVIRKNGDSIESFLESPEFGSPQGLDITPDGRFMFMADYSRGIFKIDIKTRKVSRLTPSKNSTMYGIDGLYFYRNSLIASQNGVRPERIVRLALSPELDKVERFEVLEANNPLFNDITLGVLVNKELFFIANSQWGLLGEGGSFAKPDKLKDLKVLKLKL